MRFFTKYRFLRFGVAVCILNIAASFLIEPANGSSETMWKEYYQEEEIDTIFVGSSVCSADFAPDIFDERLGVKSFNMGTPAQEIEQTIRAVEVAFAEHEIETVIYGMGFFSLQNSMGEEPEMTFVKALSREQGGLKGLKTNLGYLFSEDVKTKEMSVRYLFPWTYNHVDYTPDAVVANMWEKFNPTIAEADMESTERKNWRLEKGFRPFTGMVDENEIWSMNSYRIYRQKFENESIRYFKQLLALCKEHDVDLVVINSPHPAYDVVSCYDVYETQHEQVKSICESYGVDYYDFSLAKPELFAIRNNYFYDFEHLNYQGVQVFSNAVCDLLEKREKGESLEDSFYSVEEFMTKHEALVTEWSYLKDLP